MALVLGDNFSYQGSKPLDARLTYNTVADMKAVGDATMYEGCMAYCKELDKEYQWKSTNTVDPTTGKWREFNSGGGGGTEYTAGDGIDITNDVISTKQSEEGDIDEIIDVYPTAGELVSIVNAFNKGDIYSTQEKMIGQWISGKPLYQKTFVQSISVAVGDTAYVGDLSGLNIDFGTVSDYVMIDANGYATALTHFDTWLRVPQNNIGVTNKSTQAKAGQMYVTIQYTKTTDTAISIGETTEYSTEEKVVGTWIDGKPLWQKSFVLTSPASGNEVSIASLSNLNIDVITSFEGLLKNDSECIPFGWMYKGSATTSIFGRCTTSEILMFVSTDSYSSKPVYITLQYTKTTT